MQGINHGRAGSAGGADGATERTGRSGSAVGADIGTGEGVSTPSDADGADREGDRSTPCNPPPGGTCCSGSGSGSAEAQRNLAASRASRAACRRAACATRPPPVFPHTRPPDASETRSNTWRAARWVPRQLFFLSPKLPAAATIRSRSLSRRRACHARACRAATPAAHVTPPCLSRAPRLPCFATPPRLPRIATALTRPLAA